MGERIIEDRRRSICVQPRFPASNTQPLAFTRFSDQIIVKRMHHKRLTMHTGDTVASDL